MRARYVFGIAVILCLSIAYACYCRAALIWDGAYQLAMTLATQQPYVYLTRFHTWFLWWPTVWVSRITADPMVLQTVYGLPFLLAPLVGLLVSWWIVKRHAPHLILWVIFGVTIVTLPGQIFVINDSIFQLHLFWPLFVGLFVPLTWPKRIVLGVLAVFQFVHPIGILLLLGSAVAAGVVAAGDAKQRRMLVIRAIVMAGLCALAVAKFEVGQHSPRWHDQYAEDQAHWDVAVTQWRTGVQPMLEGLLWMYAAAGMAFLRPIFRRKHTWLGAAAGIAALLFAGRGAVRWCALVAGPSEGEDVWWTGAIDYRRWVGPLAVPFFMLIAAEVILQARRAAKAVADARSDAAATPIGDNGRGPLGLALASIFALVVGMQYTTWRHETDRLMLELTHYPSVVMPQLDREMSWCWCTPINHWAVNNYVAIMQGKTPGKIFLNTTSERLWRGDALDQQYPVDPRKYKQASPPKHICAYYPDNPDKPPGPAGWFDFRPMLERLDKEPPPTRPRRAEFVP